ncbi:PREDICTED: BUD13 homolog [Chrysochloris asiatica]|uniref:BUD13 homolog n=1 Tax=Chrysochloris asiatica TaxID=185453 RepID=A0A9B0T4H9_CHRAS|nr:PREDICTED: BUD13 homolog [Chrysochloris asiatica]
MAAVPPLSKAEYLKRYLSGADAGVDGGSESCRKRRKKRPKPGGSSGKGMRIVDDDVSWTTISTTKLEKEEEEDDGDLPVVAEFVDERPEEVKQMEAFRSSAKWKLLGGHVEDLASRRHFRHDSLDSSPTRRVHHDSADACPPRMARHDSPDASPPRRVRHDSPDASPLRRVRHDSPDASPPRRVCHDSPDSSPPRRVRHDSSDASPPRRARHDSPDLSPPRKYHHTSSGDGQQASDSDLSPPRHQRKQSPGPQDSGSDLSPPRNRPRHQSSDSDLSPPRRRQRTKSSDSDLSPPRRSQPPEKKATHMFSGAKTGLVLTDIQREQQELKKRDQQTMEFEAEFQYAETVFRDKSGRKRNLKLERLEQKRKAEKETERNELYAQWGKGLAQSRQQQQNLEDALKEMQKPLARYIDDEDLDKMLREQERDGDPMANFIKKNKAKENKKKKVRPRYSGPAPPPNRFNIWPGYRWDGVDRSNGFEQKRFARLASKKAVEELAYKWSVEDM